MAFWTAYSGRFANVVTARAALAPDRAASPSARAAALDQFRATVTAGDDGAALKLVKALLIDGTGTARTEAEALLIPLGQDGNARKTPPENFHHIQVTTSRTSKQE